MILKPETLMKRNADTLEADLHDGLALFDPARGAYFQLNAVAQEVWSALETPKTIAAICAKLLESYDVSPAACLADVQELCDDLIRKKLVVIAD